MLGLAWGLGGSPSGLPVKIDARTESIQTVPAIPQSVPRLALTNDRDLFASDEERGESNLGTTGSRKEIAFIDLGVADPGLLARSVKRGVEVQFIRTNRGGIEQISEVLARQTDVDAVHLLSHGGPGYVNLGTDVVNREVLAYYADAVRAWRASLSAKADIMVYGCEVAGSAEGKAFLECVRKLTGADVAGSDDLTGSQRLGGDWDLEHRRGEIDTVGLSPRSDEPYEATLATITVDSTADTVNGGDGVTTLREAIIAANADPDADTINFTLPDPSIIRLTSDLPDITEDVTIDGPDTKLMVHGEFNYYSIFTVYGATSPGPNVTITDLSLYYGYGSPDGGAISNYNGNVTVENCTISQCGAEEGGAVYNNYGGKVSLKNCSIINNYSTGNGGGGQIYNHGQLTATDCKIEDGTAYYGHGGGIFSSITATTTLTNTTVSSNFGRSGKTGGIHNDGTLNIDGGSITQNNNRGIVNSGEVTATGCTISENNQYYGNGVGLFSSITGSVTLTNCTVTKNDAYTAGGGILNQGDLKIVGGIISDNSAGVSWAGTGGGGIHNSGTLSIENATIAGNQARYYGDGGGILNTGKLDLTGAIIYQNGLGDNLIPLPKGAGVFNSGQLTADNCAISWNDCGQYGHGGGIYSSAAGSATLTDCDIADNRARFGGGGGVRNAGILEITGGKFTGNFSSGIVNDGQLTASDCTLSSNLTYYSHGAGLFSTITGSATLTNCTFSKNRAEWYGGGIRNDGTLKIIGGKITDNEAGNVGDAGYGGGICNTTGASLIVENAEISGNTATGPINYGIGGGIHNNGDATLTKCGLSNNFSQNVGGGIYNKSTLTVDKCTIDGNTADLGGGAYHTSGDLTVTNSTLSGNTATNGQGGGLCSDATTLIRNSTISGNQSQYEGGGVCAFDSTLDIYNSTIANNSAGMGGPMYGGGGVYLGGGGPKVTLRSTLVAGNNDTFAPTSYPDVYDYGGSLYVYNSLIQDPNGHGIADGVDGNIVGKDPMLSPLADNGGPTLTHALQLGSPAINAGENPAPALAADQRGFSPRDFGGGTDIGAFEYGNHQPTATNLDQVHGFAAGTATVPLDDIVITDPDPEGLTVTLTVADPTAGGLSAASGNGELYDAGTGVWTVMGDVVTVNAALADLAFLPNAGNPVGTTVAVDIRDGLESGVQPLSGTITLNISPIVNSVSAAPNPAAAGQLVTLAVDAFDGDGDALTITWDFGDGNTGTGATVTHAYASMGSYAVSVTVSDGVSTATGTVTVTVEVTETVAGTGPDSDGDGFSDTLEQFAGSDPDSPDSTPLGIGPVTEAQLAIVTYLRITLNLRPSATGRDKIRLVGQLPIPDGFSFAGQEVIFDIGGVQKRFTLDAQGRGKDGNTRVTFSRPKLGFSIFRLVRKFKGDYKGTLAATSGLENATVTNEPRTVRVTVLWNGVPHVQDASPKYKATQNKRGTAKTAVVKRSDR